MARKKSKLKKFVRALVGMEEPKKPNPAKLKKSSKKPKKQKKPSKTKNLQKQKKSKAPSQKPSKTKSLSQKPKPKKPAVKKEFKSPKPKKKPAKKPEKTVQQKPKPKPKKKYRFTINEVINFLNYDVSPELSKIISLLEKNDVLSENEIAEKMDIKINGARKLLYVLREWGFADYEKKSDEKKNWWFIYYWSIDKEKILKKYILSVKNEIKKREELLKEESEYSFSCAECNLKYTYREALENNFECKECGGILQDLNNEIIIKKLTDEKEQLQKKLSVIEQDLSQ